MNKKLIKDDPEDEEDEIPIDKRAGVLAVRHKYSSIYGDYVRSAYYWELVEMGRKMHHSPLSKTSKKATKQVPTSSKQTSRRYPEGATHASNIQSNKRKQTKELCVWSFLLSLFRGKMPPKHCHG